MQGPLFFSKGWGGRGWVGWWVGRMLEAEGPNCMAKISNINDMFSGNTV